ncbi:MAG: tRNA lysidine(34) synthetase TilS, partial [Flavobacterium sp.]
FVIENIEEELKFPLKLTLCNDSYIQEQNKSTIFVDADKIEFPLIIRKWREGDVFYPLGMKGSKKVSKFFKDEKISIFDKQKIWILESNKNIVWIIDYRQDDRFKVEQTTQTTLKIEFLK